MFGGMPTNRRDLYCRQYIISLKTGKRNMSGSDDQETPLRQDIFVYEVWPNAMPVRK